MLVQVLFVTGKLELAPIITLGGGTVNACLYTSTRSDVGGIGSDILANAKPLLHLPLRNPVVIY